VLADIRHEQASLWAAFSEFAHNEARALPYRDVIAAVAALPRHSSDPT
jgi:hypothetical protein